MIVYKTNASSIPDAIKAPDQSWDLANFLSLLLSPSLQWPGQWPGAVDEQ